jgi:hypothetical protein
VRLYACPGKLPAHLRDLFCLIPAWPQRRVLELAPVSWHQTIAQPDTQRRLDANIYRRVSLTPVNGSLALGNAAR